MCDLVLFNFIYFFPCTKYNKSEWFPNIDICIHFCTIHKHSVNANGFDDDYFKRCWKWVPTKGIEQLGLFKKYKNGRNNLSNSPGPSVYFPFGILRNLFYHKVIFLRVQTFCHTLCIGKNVAILDLRLTFRIPFFRLINDEYFWIQSTLISDNSNGLINRLNDFFGFFIYTKVVKTNFVYNFGQHFIIILFAQFQGSNHFQEFIFGTKQLTNLLNVPCAIPLMIHTFQCNRYVLIETKTKLR